MEAKIPTAKIPEMNASGFMVVWEFEVKLDLTVKFEEIYGPDGAWAQLFRSSTGYLGTELVRDSDRKGRYLTFDRWISRDALRSFKEDHHSEYVALDRLCENLTDREAFLGDFDRVGA